MGRTKQTTQHLDRLASVMRSIPPERLRSALVKDERIQVRVTASEKADMQQTAKNCGLTLTEYLTRLHHLAGEQLEDERLMKGKKAGLYIITRP